MSHPEDRNQRLYPRRGASRYYVLTGLRKALEEAFEAHIPNGGVVVDLGCGGRPYEPMVIARGASYVGVDRPGLPGIDREIREDGTTDLADGAVDVVLSTQVLEHVDDPRAYLSEAHRLLRDGGMLILSTHGYWMYHPDPNDLWRWTGSGLKHEIRSVGFDVVSIRGILNLGAAGLQLVQDFLSARLPLRLRRITEVILQPLVGLADRIPGDHTDEEACVFLVVAQRTETDHGH